MNVTVLQKICRTNVVIQNKNRTVTEITNLFISIVLTVYV